MKSRQRHLMASLLTTGVLVLLLPALVAIPALANPGLRVGGAILVTDVTPGKSITHTMTVGIMDGDPATDIIVQVGGIGQSLDGGYQLLKAPQDTSGYSARQFITLDKESFNVKPGTSQNVVVTISVPQDVGAGGRYALINIATKPPAGTGVGFVSAVNVPVYLTVSGSQLTHKGKITELTTGKAVSGQPVEISTFFQSTGNHHFKVKGEVAVTNPQGKVLDTIKVALSGSSVIPTMLLQMKATFMPQGELPLGVYSVKSKVMLEDGTVLDEASGGFEVEKPYVPPPPPASIDLGPSSAAILKTTDGRISISFPQGAVLSQVKVSLLNYPLEQLPAPPAGFELATTCFSVDGLTGLLAKEATVTVKYTPADLDKAGGDASRLRLARWDEGKQWTVLKTEIDKGAISTTTNRLSIWAVMVAPPAVMNWPLIGGIVAGVIIVALLIFFLIRRRRGY